MAVAVLMCECCTLMVGGGCGGGGGGGGWWWWFFRHTSRQSASASAHHSKIMLASAFLSSRASFAAVLILSQQSCAATMEAEAESFTPFTGRGHRLGGDMPAPTFRSVRPASQNAAPSAVQQPRQPDDDITTILDDTPPQEAEPEQAEAEEEEEEEAPSPTPDGLIVEMDWWPGRFCAEAEECRTIAGALLLTEYVMGNKLVGDRLDQLTLDLTLFQTKLADLADGNHEPPLEPDEAEWTAHMDALKDEYADLKKLCGPAFEEMRATEAAHDQADELDKLWEEEKMDDYLSQESGKSPSKRPKMTRKTQKTSPEHKHQQQDLDDNNNNDCSEDEAPLMQPAAAKSKGRGKAKSKAAVTRKPAARTPRTVAAKKAAASKALARLEKKALLKKPAANGDDEDSDNDDSDDDSGSSHS